VLVLAVVMGAAAPASASGSPRCGFAGVGHAVCMTYLTKAVPARAELYRHGRSSNRDQRVRALRRFHRYFKGSARRQLEAQVDSWDEGVNQVSYAVCLGSNLVVHPGGLVATLRPTERWEVFDLAGKLLLGPSEAVRHPIVTMRLRGGRWVVSSIKASTTKCS
jgi:hypothetical protein